MRPYLYALLVVSLTLFFHLQGLHGLYVAIWPYDIFMHILGGFGIGLSAYAIIQSLAPDMKHKMRTIVLIVLLAGLVWELFEIYYDIAGYTVGTLPYYLDTLKDLFDDVIGGTLAAYLMLRRK